MDGRCGEENDNVDLYKNRPPPFAGRSFDAKVASRQTTWAVTLPHHSKARAALVGGLFA